MVLPKRRKIDITCEPLGTPPRVTFDKGNSKSEILSEFEGTTSVAAVPPDPAKDPHEFLQRLVWPVPSEQFLDECWNKRAVAFKAANARHRTGKIRAALHDLDLEEMLGDSRSESIGVWFGKNGEPATSVQMDAADAFSTYTMVPNSAVYFQAPEEFIEATVAPLSVACGLNFGALYLDGEARGEIECFVSKKGHKTEWHTDFQHNFTVQLKGSKTWRFCRGPIENPIRALSPHYRTRSTYETQAKLVNAHGNRSSGDPRMNIRPDDDFFKKESVSVTLKEGDVLYHPPGIWHQVTSDSDETMAMNFSLDGARWCELIGAAVNHQLGATPFGRKHIQATKTSVGRPNEEANMREEAERQLLAAKDAINKLTVDDFLNSAMLLPRVSEVKLGVHAKKLRAGSSDADFDYRSLSALTEKTDGEGFTLHSNFGNDNIESWYQCDIECEDEETEQVLRYLGRRARERFSITMLQKEAKKSKSFSVSDDGLRGLLLKLVDLGYLKNV